MSRLVRMDHTGHSTLAEWVRSDPGSAQTAQSAFARALAEGYFAVVSDRNGSAEQVRELPLDASLVILRRPIVGG